MSIPNFDVNTGRNHDFAREMTKLNRVIADMEITINNLYRQINNVESISSNPNIVGPPGSRDDSAIHVDTASEISTLAAKTPVGADYFIIEDSEASQVKKRVVLTNLATFMGAGNHISDNVASEIFDITAIETLQDGDIFLLEDFSDSYNKKSIAKSFLDANIDHNLTKNYAATRHIDWAAAGAGTIHTDNYIEGGNDADAIHDNVAGEINNIASVSPVASDVFLIEDFSDSLNKKKTTFSLIETNLDITNLSGYVEPHTKYALADDDGEIDGMTGLGANLAATDNFLVEDATASNAKKKIEYQDLLTSLNADLTVSPFPSGTYKMMLGDFTTGVSGNHPNISDSARQYSVGATSPQIWYGAVKLVPKLTIGGVTKWLRLTNAKYWWWQAASGDDISQFKIERFDSAITAGSALVDDGTNRGGAGSNSHDYGALSSNNQLSAANPYFRVLLNVIVSGAGSDHRIESVDLEYDYQ